MPLLVLLLLTTTDMNIKEIATACIDEIEPTLKRVIESYDKAKSKNPEMIMARNSFAEKRERMIEGISAAITETVCDRQRALDAVWACWTQGADLNAAVALVRPLVTRENVPTLATQPAPRDSTPK